MDFRSMNLDNLEINPNVLQMVTNEMANTYRIVPIRFQNKILTVAAEDVAIPNAIDDLRFILNFDVNSVLADPKSLARALLRYYSEG